MVVKQYVANVCTLSSVVHCTHGCEKHGCVSKYCFHFGQEIINDRHGCESF